MSTKSGLKILRVLIGQKLASCANWPKVGEGIKAKLLTKGWIDESSVQGRALPVSRYTQWARTAKPG